MNAEWSVEKGHAPQADVGVLRTMTCQEDGTAHRMER